MTTQVMVGNLGGVAPGIGVYFELLDANGVPTGELSSAAELAGGQFDGQLFVSTGCRLVVVETPVKPAQDAAAPGAADSGLAAAEPVSAAAAA